MDSNNTAITVASTPCETPETVPVGSNTQIVTEDPQAGIRPDIDFTWDEDQPPGPQTHNLCKLLARSKELYRGADGELLWFIPGKKPLKINNAVELEGFIRYKFKIQVISGGQHSGFVIPMARWKP